MKKAYRCDGRWAIKEGAPILSLILGRVAFAQNNYQQAVASYKESLTLRQEAGEKEGVAEALEGLAGICAAQGEAKSAAQLLGAAEMLREATGIAVSPIDRAFNERTHRHRDRRNWVRTSLPTEREPRDAVLRWNKPSREHSP